MRADGFDDPMAAVMGGAVAAGVSTFAPMVRIAASRVLGVPDPVMGLLEDYLALKLGTEAVGLSMDEVTQVARHSVEDLRERVHAGHSVGRRGLDVTAERALGDAHPRVGPVGEDLVALQLGLLLVRRVDDGPARWCGSARSAPPPSRAGGRRA